MEQIQQLKDQKENIQKLYPWIAGSLFQQNYNPHQEYTEQEITMMAQNQLSEDRKKIKASIDQLNTGFQCAVYERHCDSININELLAQLPPLQIPINSEKDQFAQSYFNEIQCRQNKRADLDSKKSTDSLALNYTKYMNPHNLIFDHQRQGLKISKEEWDSCLPDQQEDVYGSLCDLLSLKDIHRFKGCLAGFPTADTIFPSLDGLHSEGSTDITVETPPSEEIKPQEIKPSEEPSTNQQEKPNPTPSPSDQTPPSSEESQNPPNSKTPPSTGSSSLTGSLTDQLIQAINNGEIQGDEKFVEYTDSQGRKVRAEIVEIKRWSHCFKNS